MGKFNLSEAAKDILSGNVSGKQSGQDKPAKLSGDVAYGTGEVDVGHTPLKTTDAIPDYTKGTPTATAPGAKPPVGSEPAKKLKGQPQQADGVAIEQPEGKTGKNQMPLNKGSVGVQQYEETEDDEEEVIAEKMHDDEKNETERKNERRYGRSVHRRKSLRRICF